jgi:hypothetical protein
MAEKYLRHPVAAGNERIDAQERFLTFSWRLTLTQECGSLLNNKTKT